jgi:hypothetical protein
MIGDGAKPALVVVPGRDGSYKDPDSLPPEDDIRSTVVSSIEDEWGTANDFVIDVRSGTVLVQHEAPPKDPYDAIGVVVVFDQLPLADYNESSSVSWTFDQCESPFLVGIRALLTEFGDSIEVWIDAVQTQSERTAPTLR